MFPLNKVALILLLTSSPAFAQFVGVQTQPESVVVKPEAVKIGTGTLTVGVPNMIHAEPITATVWGKAEMLPGSMPITASMTAPIISAPVNFTAPKDMIEGSLNVASKAVNLEHVSFDVRLMDKDAAHELAEGLKVLAAPLADVKQVVGDASAKAERDAELLAVALGIGLLLSMIGWAITHFWHKADKAANSQPKGETR